MFGSVCLFQSLITSSIFSSPYHTYSAGSTPIGDIIPTQEAQPKTRWAPTQLFHLASWKQSGHMHKRSWHQASMQVTFNTASQCFAAREFDSVLAYYVSGSTYPASGLKRYVGELCMPVLNQLKGSRWSAFDNSYSYNHQTMSADMWTSLLWRQEAANMQILKIFFTCM